MPRSATPRDTVGVAFLGAGNYAKGILLPAVNATQGVRKVAISTATGPSARRSAEKFGYATLHDRRRRACSAIRRVDLVFVATQHASHAALAANARCARARPSGSRSRPRSRPSSSPSSRRRSPRPAASSRSASTAASRRTRAAMRESFEGRRGPLAIHYAVAAGATPAGTLAHRSRGRRRPRDRRGLSLRGSLQLPGGRAAGLGVRLCTRPRPRDGRLDHLRCSRFPTARARRSSTSRARAPRSRRSASRRRPTARPRSATTSSRPACSGARAFAPGTRTRARRPRCAR